MTTDYNEQLEKSIASECKLTLANGRVANFAYNDTAYACDNVEGTATYNFSQDQNIPLGEAGVLNTTSDILAKGVRSQASSITRMLLNHFFGRTSYNVNKLADHLLSLFHTVKNFIKENDTTWSATTEYDTGDLVYFVTTLNNKKYKRTFFCIQNCLNLPPIDEETGNIINVEYWSEISGNVVSLSASESVRTKQGIIEQDLVVHGNLFVNGNTTTTTETQVASTGNYIVTRENNPSAMSSGEYSGLAINNYDTGKMATLTADHCGEWRVSDSATVSSVTYTDISTYEGIFYDGLTRNASASYPKHVMTSVSMLEMLDVVYYNDGYYKKEENSWYGIVTYSNEVLNKGSLITDSELIASLETLTPSSLIYYITVTDNIIDSSSNQPLLTRAEANCFSNGDLLMWDSKNRTAVKVTSPTGDNQKLTAKINSATGCLSYAWTDAGNVDNAACFAGCTYACAKADFRNYTPSCATNATNATNATCFAGCTYDCAKADFRNYTPSCATNATYATCATNAGYADYAVRFAGCTYDCAKADFRNYTPYCATNAANAANATNTTCFAGCTYACAKADFRGYTPFCATNAANATNTTCFAGCTYDCAKADFRNYTPSFARNLVCDIGFNSDGVCLLKFKQPSLIQLCWQDTSKACSIQAALAHIPKLVSCGNSFGAFGTVFFYSCQAYDISRLDYELDKSIFYYFYNKNVFNQNVVGWGDHVVVCCTDTACTGTRGLVFIPYMPRV